MTSYFTCFIAEIKSVFNSLKWYEKTYYFFALFCLVLVTIIFKGDYFPLFVSLCSITASILNAKSFWYCFYFFAFTAFSYSFLAFENRFYGEFILNLFFLFPVYMRGIFRWRFKKNQQIILEISDLSFKQMLLLVLLGVAVTGIYGYVLRQIGSALPYFNALATFACATAAILATKRIIQQWYFWFLYTFALIVIWAYSLTSGTAQISFLILNILFIGFNWIGYINWYRLKKYLSDAEVCK